MPDPLNRRSMLTFGAVGALGFWTAPALGAARQPDPKEGRPPLQFSAMIPGCADASKNIREIAIDELNIDLRQTTGRDNDFWSISPSSASMGLARFTIGGSPAASKELQAWFQEAAKGKNIRKNISVTLHRDDKKTARTFNLVDCFPQSYSNVNFDTSSTVQTETLTLNFGRIEFKT